MKLGMTSLTLKNESVENVIKYAKKAGLDGIEWGVSETHVVLGDDSSFTKIKELSRENKIDIFSLGSYCKMTDRSECDAALIAAVKLNAPIIRIWAGEKSPCGCSGEYADRIAENTVYMAKKAEKYNIRLGFEYHHHTLTETADSAVELAKRIGCSNVGLYWQPDAECSAEENISSRNKVLPYSVGNIHIQNYTEAGGYMLLEKINDRIHLYFDDIKDKDYKLMIEFVKDGTAENLIKDAAVLKKLLA